MNIIVLNIIIIILTVSFIIIGVPWYAKQLGRHFAAGVYEYWEEKDFIKFRDLLELPKIKKEKKHGKKKIR